MGTTKGRIPPDRDRKAAGSPSNGKAAPKGGNCLDARIKNARASLHDAIRRAGDRPLSQSPEVLRLSRALDDLIDELQSRDTDI